MTEPLIYDISSPGRRGVRFPEADVPKTDLPDLLRADLALPEVAEIDVVRHFTRLSQLNHSIDTGFYPLGSCTMKYNPKINEVTAALPGFQHIHPLQPIDSVQGSLMLMYAQRDRRLRRSDFATRRRGTRRVDRRVDDLCLSRGVR